MEGTGPAWGTVQRLQAACEPPGWVRSEVPAAATLAKAAPPGSTQERP